MLGDGGGVGKDQVWVGGRRRGRTAPGLSITVAHVGVTSVAVPLVFVAVEVHVRGGCGVRLEDSGGTGIVPCVSRGRSAVRLSAAGAEMEFHV